MIIRKPFAFIVRHFRKLHLLMLIPLIFLAYKSYYLMDFFNSYVVAGYKTELIDVSNIYFNLFIPLSCLLLLFFIYLIIHLFNIKHKEHTSYNIVFIFYLVLFFISLFLSGILSNFETKSIDSAVAILFSGLSKVIFYMQPVMIFIFFFNGMGFDFRNFEFVNIKDEISINEEDSEEVEVNLGIEDYQFKRGIRRYFRELKYYVIENKAFFVALGSIFGLVLLFFVGKWIISLNRIVKIDKSFSHSYFSVSFNDSVLSTIDYNGNIILKGKVYLAVKTTIKNNTKGLLTLDTDNFWLDVNGDYYYPKLDRSGKFIDLGKPYYGERVGAGDQQEIVLVYELDELDIKDKYKIKVLDSITYKENAIIPKYKEITLKPRYSSTVSTNGYYNMGDTLSLSNTTLLNTNLKFDNYSISKTYQYNYNYCYNEKFNVSTNIVTASANSMLLTLNGDISLDEKSSYYKYKMGSNKFAEDFMKVVYYINNIENRVDVKDVTPSDSNGITVLEASSEIRNADSIMLEITIRNERYYYVIK